MLLHLSRRTRTIAVTTAGAGCDSIALGTILDGLSAACLRVLYLLAILLFGHL